MKEYFCSNCGTPLKWTRKGLPNRQEIVDLIDPHECDASNISNIEDSDKPFNPIKQELDYKEKEARRSLMPGEDWEPDRRSPQHKREVKSSAPASLIDKVKHGSNTQPENDFSDLEKALDND